jgi:hypothetical protein
MNGRILCKPDRRFMLTLAVPALPMMIQPGGL